MLGPQCGPFGLIMNRPLRPRSSFEFRALARRPRWQGSRSSGLLAVPFELPLHLDRRDRPAGGERNVPSGAKARCVTGEVERVADVAESDPRKLPQDLRRPNLRFLAEPLPLPLERLSNSSFPSPDNRVWQPAGYRTAAAQQAGRRRTYFPTGSRGRATPEAGSPSPGSGGCSLASRADKNRSGSASRKT